MKLELNKVNNGFMITLEYDVKKKDDNNKEPCKRLSLYSMFEERDTETVRKIFIAKNQEEVMTLFRALLLEKDMEKV